MSATLRPTGRSEQELAAFRDGLELGLEGGAVVGALEPGRALLLFPGADCSLSFWEDASRGQVLVRWRITVREAPPGLGTWWADGEAAGPIGEWSALGRSVGRTLSEDVLRYAVSLSMRGQGAIG